MSAGIIQAQNSNDTIKIQLGSEHITLPMPKTGNKVTVNLEDSGSIIQISVGKISKSASVATASMSRVPLEPESKKRVSWFREVELGTLYLLSTGKEQRADTAIFYRYQDLTNGTSNPSKTSFIKITPERVYPGFSLGLNIKEKRRPFKNTKMTYITGFKFRYNVFVARGNYEVTEVKSEVKNGVFRYYADSVLSVTKGNYNSRTSIYQFVFPFMLEFNSKKSYLTYSAGLQLVVGFNSSKIITKSGENLKNTNMIISYTNPQLLQIQPAFRVNYKKLSAQLSASLGTSRVGYGATQYFRGNMCFLSIGYKLY
jgi:hypothetical protein